MSGGNRFKRIEDVISSDEMATITEGYKRIILPTRMEVKR